MNSEDRRATSLLYDPELPVKRDLSAWLLLVDEGADAGRYCCMGEKGVFLGTDPSADLVLTDDTVSRRHLLVRKEEEGVRIQDLDSTNGTFFEGSRVKEIVVGLGCAIRVGKTLLKIVPAEKTLRPEPARESAFGQVLGQSRRMREIFATLGEVAPTDLTVLIEGETGTGKEAVAEALHQRSQRREGPFVVVDCTTIPRELVESELFGHRKGAFTGAVTDRNGCFEQASGGTLFLDEVGDLPLESQPKLLRVLERRQMRPVGSDRTVDLDLRMVAATRQDLRREVAEGRFREDLYYRLAVVSVRLPPLRERPEDLALLMEHFVRRALGGKLDFQISAAALDRFRGHAWPGNVRELRNVVERAVALKGAGTISLESLVNEIERGLGEMSARRPGPLPYKEAKSQVVDSFERSYLADLLERCGGNTSKAAREARLDRHHLRDLLEKHGIRAK